MKNNLFRFIEGQTHFEHLLACQMSLNLNEPIYRVSLPTSKPTHTVFYIHFEVSTTDQGDVPTNAGGQSPGFKLNVHETCHKLGLIYDTGNHVVHIIMPNNFRTNVHSNTADSKFSNYVANDSWYLHKHFSLQFLTFESMSDTEKSRLNIQ